MERVITQEDLTSIAHLNFDSFQMDLSKPQIIWAPNGVGKSSIYRVLEELGLERAQFIACDDMREEFVRGTKRNLLIGSHLEDIERIEANIKRVVDSCEINDGIKLFALTNKNSIKAVLPNFPDLKKDQVGDILAADTENATLLASRVEDNGVFFISHLAQLRDCREIVEDVKQLKESYLRSALKSLRRCVNDDVHVCPVCGSRSGSSIVSLLDKRLEELQHIEKILSKDLAESKEGMTLDDVEKTLTALCEVAADAQIANEKAILAYCISGGDIAKLERIRDSAKTLGDLDAQLRSAKEKRNAFYAKLKACADEIKGVIAMKFGVDDKDISFDDDLCRLNIKLPRNANEYSTGEITLMLLTVHLNEFRASDANLLVLDDPITSFDSANQYVIMFDLIRLVQDEGKCVIVLTHNTNCINIADSQHASVFRYANLDRSSNNVQMLPLDIARSNSGRHRYLCFDSLCETVEKEGRRPYTTYVKYLKAVSAREDEADPKLHSVFHYNDSSGLVAYEGEYLTNDFMVSLIDGFDVETITGGAFAERCISKAILLTALRVWVEKQIFDLHGHDSRYLSKERTTLQEKIDYAFPRKGGGPWSGSPKVTRGYLMGKKVMLNQASHEAAQSIPFEYALNLSILDIEKTIQDVKAAFSDVK